MVSVKRSASEVRLETNHQHQVSSERANARHGKQGTSWGQRGLLALAATSGLVGTASAKLTPFADLASRGAPQRQGGLKTIPTVLKPGHATYALVANRGTTVTAPPALTANANTWYGLSAQQNAVGQDKNAGLAGRRLLGLTPFGGGGKPPPAHAPAPSSVPTTPDCGAPQAPQPSPTRTGTLITAQLQGCPMSDYSAPVNVGGQAFLAIADTGSTTFGVVSTKCTDCDTSTGYKPGSSSKDDKEQIEADYGSGAWRGELTNDVVSFAGGPSANIAFGAIYDQKDWITGNGCDLTANSPGAPINQAIMGLAGPQLLIDGTDSWLAKTNSSFAYPAITFGLCDQNGAVYVGGYPQNNAASALIFTPMATSHQSPYIAVAMEGISVGKTSVGATLKTLGYTIVDTGTTAIILPPDVYTATASAISKATQGSITQDFFDQGNCVSLDSTSISDLNAQAPSLTFSFYNAANSSVVNTLETPSSNSYLLAQSDGNGGLIVCPDMVNSGSDDPQTALGNTIMRGFLTIFDYEKQQVGFPLSKGVCKTS